MRPALPILAVLLLPVAGCGLFGGDPPPTQPWQVEGDSGAPASLAAPPTHPGDPRPSAVGTHVGVWLVSVPRGAVSGNAAFWRRIDESALPAAKSEALFANGIRVGVARQEDWPRFRDLIDNQPARFTRTDIVLADEQAYDLPARAAPDGEVLSLFDPSGRHRMTSYGPCENALKLSIAPAPRRADAVRTVLTPIVRLQETRVELTLQSRIERTAPTFLYDLALAAEVPIGQFLVIAPSADIDLASSIGRNFLVLDGGAEQRELILIVAPGENASPPKPQDPTTQP